MNADLMPDPIAIDNARVLAVSLALGLLIGVDRERKGDSRGLRTFALTALCGAIVGLLDAWREDSLVLAGALVMLGGLAMAMFQGRRHESPATSVIALLATFLAGVLTAQDHAELAVALTIITAGLLVLKSELAGVSRQITQEDVRSVLQFGALAFIILPLVPNRSYGPYGGINPYEVWLMVVLIAGVGLVGYVALRLLGTRYGAILQAIAGGMVSSTATTLVAARQASQLPPGAPMPVLMTLVANATVMLRLTALSAAIAPALLPTLAPVFGLGGLATAATCLWLWRRMQHEAGPEMADIRNPTQLKVAIGFGLAYAVVAWLSTWASAEFGSSGLYVVAVLSGSTDVDAISLSSLRLASAGDLEARACVTAIVLALLSNTAVKAGIVYGNADRVMGHACLKGFLIGAAGLLLGLATLYV